MYIYILLLLSLLLLLFLYVLFICYRPSEKKISSEFNFLSVSQPTVTGRRRLLRLFQMWCLLHLAAEFPDVFGCFTITKL